jgi:hypothetical protein
MMKSIGAAALALTLMFAATVNPAAAAPASVQKPEASKATDLTARHHTRHHQRDAYRPDYQPRYYDRPYYYAPAPFVPFNFGYPLLPPPWW